ncbi:hypothetical protein MHB65_17100 [Lysinibacillus sp. FSL K6-0075]|jgi:hypothetical protein|uniref:hypothetical protein n=1 Tax=Lysinibacillus TaxID=400634 RepID=UPI000F95EA8A|nr:hypothetical protein [Lysinibacillus fusiformis]QSB10421.1 hypothetical protein JTI58_01505 [Lysinibacillus fusiformis]
MDEKKKGKLQILVIILMLLLLVATFVLFFIGKYMVAFILFGIFMLILNFISSWKNLDNADYVYRKIHKSNQKW